MTPKQLAAALLKPPFWNIHSDRTNPEVWDVEIDILTRIMAGEVLETTRFYSPDHKGYAVVWYWQRHPDYPAVDRQAEYDCPVMRLMARGAIRRIQCFGGAGQMVLTPMAKLIDVPKTAKGRAAK